MLVELRAVPGCPNLEHARALLRACLAEAGLPATFTERIGDYPSPSVLVDGVDVSGGDPNGPPACLLRLPSAEDIHAALARAGHEIQRRAVADNRRGGVWNCSVYRQ